MTVIDLHTAMRKARDARTAAFSGDKVHPGDDGHLLMAKTILAALGVKVPDETLATIKADPLFKLVEQKRATPVGRVDEAHRLHPREDREARTARHRRGGRGETPGEDRRNPPREMTSKHTLG